MARIRTLLSTWMTRRAWASTAAVIVAATVVACTGSVAVRTAEDGDLAALRAQIESAESTRALTLSQVAEIARAVLVRELTQGPREQALARVRDVRGCAPELDDTLAVEMKTMDAAGAEAAMARFDAGVLSSGDVRGYASSPVDAWRAVGVRGMTRERDDEARRRALLDPSPLVRRAAVRAMVRAEDDQDLPVAFDAARLDPDPMVRTEAVRLLASFGRAGRDVARELSDLYDHADDAIREDIGAAWAAPGVFERGGRDALRVLLASEQGPGAIAAAAAVLRESAVADPEIVSAARAELVRAIAAGPRRNRLHAIAVAPVKRDRHEAETAGGTVSVSLSVDRIIDALEEASRDEDPEVRVSALGRVATAEIPAAERNDAVARLLQMGAMQAGGRWRSRARQLLAQAGDARVQAWIEEDLRNEDPLVRLSAAEALIALGRASRAAPILADPDASARTRGACALLVAARLGSPLR